MNYKQCEDDDDNTNDYGCCWWLESILRKVGLSSTVGKSDELETKQKLLSVNSRNEEQKSSHGLGRIQFAVQYNFTNKLLTIKIVQATDLPAKDLNGFSDPYVKVILAPDKSEWTTSVKYKTLSPRWNELFVSKEIPVDTIIKYSLCLQVLDHNRFSADDVIGEVILPMTAFDLAKDQTMWKNLMPSRRSMGRLGELYLSMSFNPSSSELNVTVIKARHLKAKDLNGLSDPYVDIWRTQNGRRMEKKTTSVKQMTLNPTFEETFSFTVTQNLLITTSLEVIVMDEDKIGRNETIGTVVLGSTSGPKEVQHWNEMLAAQAGKPVTHWHVLR